MRQILTQRTELLEQSNKEIVERTQDLVATRKTLVERTVLLEQTNKDLLERTQDLVATRETLVERTRLLEQSNEDMLGRTEHLERVLDELNQLKNSYLYRFLRKINKLARSIMM